MLELYQLVQLLAIAECGTISKAAEQLHLSQPALSRSMQKLEEELQVTLFDRQKNKITLNKNGRLAVEQARRVVEQAQSLVDQVRAFDRSQRTISIGCCAPAPLVELVSLVSQLYPGNGHLLRDEGQSASAGRPQEQPLSDDCPALPGGGPRLALFCVWGRTPFLLLCRRPIRSPAQRSFPSRTRRRERAAVLPDWLLAGGLPGRRCPSPAPLSRPSRRILTSWCRLPPFPAFLQTGQSGSTASRKTALSSPFLTQKAPQSITFCAGGRIEESFRR